MPLYNPAAITSHLLATPDNTYDIGASGATRPRTIYVGTNVIVASTLVLASGSVSSTGALALTGGTSVGVTATGANAITFTTNSSARWNISSSGHLLANTDNAVDIGASGATRPRNLYLAGAATIGGTAAITGALSAGTISSGAIDSDANISGASLSSGGAVTVGAHINLAQIADTGAPGSNTINVFAMDNGGSSTLALRCEQAVASESVTSDRTLTVYINNVAYKICLKA